MEADMSTRATAEVVSIIWDGRMLFPFGPGWKCKIPPPVKERGDKIA